MTHLSCHAFIRRLTLLAALCFPASASAVSAESEDGESGVILDIHARTYSLFTFTPQSALSPDATTSAFVVERLRPTLEAWRWGVMESELAWDVLPLIGGSDGISSGFAVQRLGSLRLVDFEPVLYQPDPATWQLRHNLDRVNVALDTDRLQVRLGRQGVGFGPARLFPVVDIFAPFGPATIDTQFKRGVDALRVTAPVGEGGVHELEAIVVANGTDDLAQWFYLGKWSMALPGVLDAAVMAGMSYARPTLGVSASGDVLGAGWYGEVLARYDLDAERVVTRATLGLDYQLPFDLRVLVEANYNGAGDSDDYTRPLLMPDVSRQAGEVFLLGEWYGGASLSYGTGPLTNVSLGYIQNLTDGSALLTGAGGWDYSETVTLGAGVIAPLGERPVEGALGPQVVDEFGVYPFVLFTDVRFVF